MCIWTCHLLQKRGLRFLIALLVLFVHNTWRDNVDRKIKSVVVAGYGYTQILCMSTKVGIGHPWGLLGPFPHYRLELTFCFTCSISCGLKGLSLTFQLQVWLLGTVINRFSIAVIASTVDMNYFLGCTKAEWRCMRLRHLAFSDTCEQHSDVTQWWHFTWSNIYARTNQSKTSTKKEPIRVQKSGASLGTTLFRAIHFNMASRRGKVFHAKLPSLPDEDAFHETSEHDDGCSSCSTLSVRVVLLAKLNLKLCLSLYDVACQETMMKKQKKIWMVSSRQNSFIAYMLQYCY